MFAILLALITTIQPTRATMPTDWPDHVLSFPYPAQTRPEKPQLILFRQDFEQLERNRSVIQTSLTIGDRRFQRGLGTHSVSHIRIRSPRPITRFRAWVGVDSNERTSGGLGSVTFHVEADGRELARSPVLRGGQPAQRMDVEVGGGTSLDLRVADAGDGPGCDHADWAEAQVELDDGSVHWLDALETGLAEPGARYPFRFLYGGRESDALLPDWPHTVQRRQVGERAITITTWADPGSGLRVILEATRFRDFPAVEWLLRFANEGTADTAVIEEVHAMDLTLRAPYAMPPYSVFRLNGGTPTPDQFEPATLPVSRSGVVTLGSGAGRSSSRNFPFFKIEARESQILVAVGWSGSWSARLECPDPATLRVTAGLEKTRFVLHPGEKVRGPRMLALYHAGDTRDSHSQFRRLIATHYAARRAGKPLLPIPFSNTCFTRGGGWLNECNAENQISLIRAYAPLGLEAVITDAGWFEGGWPAGAGNWNPRKDAYPEGMGPVAKAALDRGMVYGLWYEPERVVAGTEIHRTRPEWVLGSQAGPQETYLLNFGLPEVQEYFFRIVEGFMRLPGFRVYRQDFNMDPLAYWRYNDAQDRQGITEMKYIEGLYAYWDRLAEAWPDSLREECASGGHRMDLETVMRFQIHQKTDYWFDNEVDQASIWALSHFLPNSTFVAPIARLDDYTFHSTLATSLCIGWIADAPDFDTRRAKRLMERYLRLRPLLNGDFYPLLPYTRDLKQWMAWQHHRPDLGRGMVLAFRRPQSPYRTVEIALRGLNPKAAYTLRFESGRRSATATGAELMRGYALTIQQPHKSELIEYQERR